MRDAYLLIGIIAVRRSKTTKLQRNIILGIALSATLLSVLAISSLHAYAYHDSLAAKQYGMKNSNLQSPSKHIVSVSGKITNFKGAQLKDPATIDMTIHKWNQYKPGATYSIEAGVIKAGNQEYKIDHGVMIAHKSDEFLIIMKNQRGEVLGMLHGYMNGGYKELQENKPVKLIFDKGSPVSLSNDGKEFPKKGTFVAESGTLNPVR